jgi:endonuclease III
VGGRLELVSRPREEKRPFDAGEVLARIEEAVRPFPKAALFELAAEGHASVLEQAVACVISTRTHDEVTLPAARRLFAAAPTAEAMAGLDPAEIDALIQPCTFHGPKARQIQRIALAAVAQGGAIPCSEEVIDGLPGVGPKCRNLVLGVACGEARISVDVHVHRITHRWGIVSTRSPEETTGALERRIPRDRWLDVNRLLVPFGKHVCTGVAPRCSTCPVIAFCHQVGVTARR